MNEKVWWKPSDHLRHLLFGCPSFQDDDYDSVYYEGYCPVCHKDLCK